MPHLRNDEEKLAHDLALKFLKTGTATLAEIAPLAGVTRQAVHQWAVAAKIKPVWRRKRHLRALWDEAKEAMQA